MHRLALLVAFTAASSSCATVDRPPVALPADLAVVLGGGWTGTLTYRDYSPPYGEVKLPVEATIATSNDGLRVALHYPTEPQADSTELMVLSRDGTSFDGAPLVARTLRGDTVELTTRAPGQDDNRPATIEHTISLGARRLTIRKTVQFSDAAPIQRNEFVLTR